MYPLSPFDMCGELVVRCCGFYHDALRVVVGFIILLAPYLFLRDYPKCFEEHRSPNMPLPLDCTCVSHSMMLCICVEGGGGYIVVNHSVISTALLDMCCCEW